MESGLVSQPQQNNRDRVTISVFAVEHQMDAAKKYMIPQIKDITVLKEKLYQAAKDAGRIPPQIVISVLIIPNWAEKSDYKNEKYLATKDGFFKDFLALLRGDSNEGSMHDSEDVVLEDFYSKKSLTDVERLYLEGLVAKGSNADMIKTHAIICPENTNRRHLQIDSNTKIFDFKMLYNETFGKNEKEQEDALNASFYDVANHYVSAHNKIVYTTVYTKPESHVSSALKTTHLAYCKEHKDDHEHTDDSKKIEKITKNSIYSKDFVVALSDIGLTHKKTLTPPRKPSKDVYLAAIDRPEYRITRCIATAVNMSWRLDPTSSKELEGLSVKIGDAECDYSCFANAALKYSDHLENHGDDLYDDTQVHELFINISNQRLEKEMIKSFVEKVKTEKPDMLEEVIKTMVLSTERGKALFQELFECTYEDYLYTSATKKLKQ
jgi:hypothetical protein